MKNFVVASFLSYLSFSCAQVKDNDVSIENTKVNFSIETVFSNVSIPWGFTWLPDGAMLVGDKAGKIFLVKNTKSTAISTGIDDLYLRGQGGLLDITIHPNYTENGWIYITYASTQGIGEGGNTKLIRTKLKDSVFTNTETLYKASPNTTAGVHFGSRIVFDNDGYLYFTIGDRGNRDENPQDLLRDGGKTYRLHDDGRIPNDNPFVTINGAKSAIFTYGHRNQQGIALHPDTGELWSHEHGPKGGDEINIHKKGENYGWPVISYGVNYSGTTITDETERTGMTQPIYYWTPSIAPSGITFVTGNNYPQWKGHLLVGSLKFQYLELLKIEENKVVERQKIAENIGRVRTVKMGPDNYIYLGVEGMGIVKLLPN